MASLIGTLYPPVIDTFMPAFIYTEGVRVYYSLPSYGDLNNINLLHITVTDQETNQNALKNNAGIYIVENPLQFFDKDKQQYYIKISNSMLKSNFKCNQFYKIQLRFDCHEEGSIPVGNQESAAAVNAYVMDINNQAYFSEWSTVCLVRPIYEPALEIIGLSDEHGKALKEASMNLGMMPIAGRLWFWSKDENGNDESDTKEQLRSYQLFILDDSNEELLSTDIIYTSNEFNNNNINTVLNLMNLNIDFPQNVNSTTLNLKIKYTTNNLYEGVAQFPFTIIQYVQGPNDVIYKAALDDENGFINLITAFTKTENDRINIAGETFFYLMRASSEDNFKNWQVLYSNYINMLNDDLTRIDKTQAENLLHETPDRGTSIWGTDKKDKKIDPETGKIIYVKRSGDRAIDPEDSWIKPFDEQRIIFNIVDHTVQSMTWYKYCVQYYIPGSGLTAPVFYVTDDGTETIFPQFYDLLFSRQEIQVPIRFNPAISSYKKNVARTKIDTLGGRYPKFAENAIMNYRQYSISGTISANMDDMKTFIKKSDYFSEEEVQRLYKEFLANKNAPSLLTEHTRFEEQFNEQGNSIQVETSYIPIEEMTVDTIGYEYYEWLWERVFREKLYDWLNDGEPKLMRSLPEGNVIVMLTDISLTPNTQLGRLISDFTCTAYEVGDGTGSLDQLRQLGVLAYPANTYSSATESSASNSVFSTYGVPAQVVIQDYMEALKQNVNGSIDIDDNVYYNIYVNNNAYVINGHKGVSASEINFVDIIKENITLDGGYGISGLNKNKVLNNFYISDIKITFGEMDRNNLSTFYLGKDGSWYAEGKEGDIASRGHLIIFNNDTRIFTNQNIYETPSDFIVTSLTFEESSFTKLSNIQIDCLAHFSYTLPGESKVFSRVEENIHAQYNQVFHSYEWLDKKIKAEKDLVDADTRTKIYLRNWTGEYIETAKPSVYIIKDNKGITQREDFLFSDKNGYYDMSTLTNFQDIAYVGNWLKKGNFIFDEKLFSEDRRKPMSEIKDINKVQKWWIPRTVQTFGVSTATDEIEPLDNIVDTYYNDTQYTLNDSGEYDFYWTEGGENSNG